MEDDVDDVTEQTESEMTITQPSESDTDYTEDFYTKFNKTRGWQSLILLQFESHMSVGILLGIYVGYFHTAIDMAIGLGARNKILSSAVMVPKKMLYAFDILYFIDFISMVMYRNINWERTGLRYKPRHGIILLIEFLSIIPLPQMYGVIVEKPLSHTFHALRLRYALRLCRLYCFYETISEYVGAYSHLLHLIVYLFTLFLLVVTTGCISYVYDCKIVIGECEEDYDRLGKHLYLSGVTYFMIGAKSSVRSPLLDCVFFSLVPYILNTYFLSYFVVDILQTIRMKFKHMTIFEWLTGRILIWRQRYKKDWKSFHVKYDHHVQDVAHILWKKTKGYMPHSYLGAVLPPIMYKELSLDISWAALKHSHLFRNEEVFFLRAISSVMQHKYLSPGEIVYKRNQFKNAMVYIISGAIDILSEEDGETPILTLASGTCLGESTLVTTYQSNCTVVSKTVCDIAILHRKNFLKLQEQYPEKLVAIRQKVFQRIRYAKKYRSLSLYQQRMQNMSERIGVVTMRWLQLTLRRLLSNNVRAGDVYDKYYLQSLEENIFCSKYLDLLNMAQDIHLVIDSVFVRNKFPFIFKPDSILLTTWNVGILAVVLVLSIAYPVYVIFSKTLSDQYIILNIVVTVIWIVDLYIKSSTMVQDKYIIYTNVSDIIIHNLSHATYLLDILCIIPTEMLLYFIIGKLKTRIVILAYCNRLLKFYRIELFFQNIRLKLFVHVILKYIKYGIYLVLLIYYTAAVLYIIGLEYSNDESFQKYLNLFAAKTTYDIMFLCISSAVTFFGNMDITVFPYIGCWFSCIAIVLLQMGTFLFFIYFRAHAAAAHTLKQENYDKIMDFLRDIDITLKCFNINKELQKRVWCYVTMQLEVTDIYFLIGRQYINFLPPDLFVMTVGIAIGDLIRNQQLFFELSDQILSEICAVATIHVLPAMEIIKYAGEVCTEIHILSNGQCSMICIDGQSKTVYPGECFSMLECSLNIPSKVTVKALTNCKIVSIKFNVFKAILLRWPQEYQVFQDTVQQCNILEISERIKPNFDVSHEPNVIAHKQMNIKAFGYSMKKRTKKYYTYHEGFPRWAFLLKYLLLRYTFYCNGTIVFYWEIARCIFALATCFLFPFTILYKSRLSGLHMLISFFDITSFLDIYFRHHVSYYNEDGLEITHPYKTATFYWKHSFLIDLLGSLPIYSIAERIISLRYDMLYFLNRIIQLYRVQGLKKHIFSSKIRVKSAFALLTYLPFLIISCNVIGAWVFATICDVRGYYVDCVPHTWLYTLSRQASKFEVYSYSILFTISGMLYNSFGIIDVYTLAELTWFVAAIFLGIFIQVYMIALVVSTSFSINRDLVSYQEAMQQLVKFLNYRKIDKNIKCEIVDHFEYKWYKTKGKSIQKTFSPFKTSFKIEALYNIYGSIFKQSSIFPEPNQSFFKSLLLDIKHETYLKTGILYSVNDINGDIFFLLKGKVEVVGADQNKLLTLRMGSVFGNLDNCPIGRRTLAMVASGHVEVLKISSYVFYSHLSKFPLIKKHFLMLTIFNIDYLEEKRQKLEIKRTAFDIDAPDGSQSRVKSLIPKRRRKIFIKNKFIQFWENVVLNIFYFSNYIFELYHMSTGDNSLALTLILYTFDIFYILKIYFKFHTTFDNEFGQVINDHKEIARHYLKDKFGFYFDISTVLPFDLISLFFLNTKYLRFVWAICRFNRLPRVILLFLYLNKHSQMLNINVFTIKTIYLLVKIILAQITLGAFIALIRTKSDKHLQRLKVFFDSIMMITNSCSKFPFDLSTFKNNQWVALSAVILVFTCKYITWYFIAQTCSLLYVVNFTRSNYEQFIIFMNRYMESEGVSAPLAKQISTFTQLLWARTSGNLFPRLLEEAPYYLKEAVLNSMFGFHLLVHPLLRHCHKDLMRQMASHMKTTILFPGNTIVYAGDIDSTMYFIHEGEIKVLSEDTMCSEVVEQVLRDGDMFGLEQGLHERLGHEYTYRVIKTCVLIALKRDDWIYLLDFFPASKRVIYDKTEVL